MRSIYWKITIPFILLLVAGMSLLGSFLVNSQRQTQLNYLQEYLTNKAKLVANASLPAFMDPAGQNQLDTLSKKFGDDIQSRVTLIAADGQVVGDSWENPFDLENQAGYPEIVAALQTGLGISQRTSITGENTLYVAVPVNNGQTELGVVRLASSLTAVNSAVNNSILIIIFSTLLAALLIVMEAFFINRIITRFTRRITRFAGLITSGQYNQIISIQSDDDLGKLGHAFNRMFNVLKENMLQLSSESHKLSTVLYALSDGVVMTDNRGQMLLANPSAENLFGFKESRCLGAPLIEAIFNHEIETLLNKCLASQSRQVSQIDTSSGKFLRVYALPLKTEKLAGAVLLIQDLTELRNLHTMRRQFVGNISHELKTPLAGIKAIVETLQDGAINEPAVAEDFLKKAAFEVESMTQLVHELTELTRIETGEARLSKEAFNLNSLVAETAARLSPQAARKQIQITFALAPDLPFVQADRERIQQVISNILHNAIKFTPPGGQISISTTPEENYVVTRIKDTGMGISKEDLIHIFERFFKADKSRSHEGSGLGLAIAKHIVQAHSGRIWVESQEGRGSTFSFSLPTKIK